MRAGNDYPEQRSPSVTPPPPARQASRRSHTGAMGGPSRSRPPSKIRRPHTAPYDEDDDDDGDDIPLESMRPGGQFRQGGQARPGGQFQPGGQARPEGHFQPGGQSPPPRYGNAGFAPQTPGGDPSLTYVIGGSPSRMATSRAVPSSPRGSGPSPLAPGPSGFRPPSPAPSGSTPAPGPLGTMSPGARHHPTQTLSGPPPYAVSGPPHAGILLPPATAGIRRGGSSRVFGFCYDADGDLNICICASGVLFIVGAVITGVLIGTHPWQ